MWNGLGGRGWIEAQELLDRAFLPFEERLAAAVSEAGAERVLDVGCGTGATTLEIARRLGAESRCLGVDISRPMIDAARHRAEREGVAARFLCADAGTHAFETSVADAIVSRFGVMFFDDPLRAFANLRRAAAEGAVLHWIVWRDPAQNPFMTAAERAAEPFLPGISERAPDAPGQFGLADPERTRMLLSQGGWRAIEISPLDLPCAFPASVLDLYLSLLGPVGRALRKLDAPTRERILAAVRPAFDPYLSGDQVRFTAACWTIVARAAP